MTGPEHELSLRVWAQEAEAAAGIARSIVGTPFVPDSLRRYSNPLERDPSKKILDLDGTVATVTAVLLAGQELNMPPMASLRAFTIIKGTVAMYAIAARALLLNHGHEIVVVESTSTRAIVRGRRADGDGEWQQSVWDLDRAKQAGLYPGHPEGNWRKQTKAMLVARATAEASRWIGADAMMGIPALVEELDDNGQPVTEIESAQTEPRSTEPKAIEGPKTTPRTTKRKTTPARSRLPTSAPPPQPPDRVEPVPEEPAPAAPRASKAQLNKMHGGLRGIGVTDKEGGLSLITAWAERPEPLTSTADLTPAEADRVLDRLDALLKVAKPPADDDQGAPPNAEHDDR